MVSNFGDKLIQQLSQNKKAKLTEMFVFITLILTIIRNHSLIIIDFVVKTMEKELANAFSLVSKGDNNSIKAGQSLLANLKRDANYPLVLLNFMQSAPLEGKLRAAIQLRLWCQTYKNMEQYQRKMFQTIIEDVKKNIVIAYLNFDLKISKTLRPGIVSLADVHFPDQWASLIPGLIAYAQQNPGGILPTLKIIQSISQKYNYSTRSDPLYHEIIIMCNQSHDFLLNLAQHTLPMALNISKQSIVILRVLMRVFYNLNYQDLHPKFQDNLQKWMNILNNLMKLNNSNQQVINCKGATLQAILLYASKYKDDVEEAIKGFCKDIWDLCAKATEDPEYDNLVFNCLKYFKSLVLWPDMKQFFMSNIEALMSNLIIPNISPNSTTVSLFEQENQTYIEYYFKNAQVLTRRASAVELLRTLCRYYGNYQGYLQSQIMNFKDTKLTPLNKSMIITLLIQSCSKGFRDIDGTTQLFVSQNIVTYGYQTFVKSSFNQIYQWILDNPGKLIESEFNTLYLATLLRYVFYFRIYLPVEDLSIILKLCSTIRTESAPLNNVILITISAFLSIKHGDFMLYKNLNYYFKGDNLKDVAIDIFKTVYENDQKLKFLSQNLTRVLFTLVSRLGSSSPEYFDYFFALIQAMLNKTFQYDFKPALLLFETIGILVFWLLKTESPNASKMEQHFHKYFKAALNTQTDLLNFCFQINAIFLEFSQKDSGFYSNVYQSIMAPTNWCEQNLSIMSSYIQYITIYVRKNQRRLVEDKDRFGVILTKLIQLEHYQLFYRLMSSILKITDLQGFYNSGYLNITIQGTEIISEKSIMSMKTAVLFLFKMAYNYNTLQVIRSIQSVKTGIFSQLLIKSKDIIQTMQNRKERKIMFGALVNIIATQALGSYQIDGMLLNLLIDNTTCRFSRALLGQAIKSRQEKQKKQATYQKLTIFTQIDSSQEEIDIDQEKYLLKAYEVMSQKNSPALNLVTQQNIERIKRIFQKHQKN